MPLGPIAGDRLHPDLAKGFQNMKLTYEQIGLARAEAQNGNAIATRLLSTLNISSDPMYSGFSES